MHLSRCVCAWSCLMTDLKRDGVKNSSAGLVLPVGGFLLYTQTNPAVPQRGRVGCLWSHHAARLDTHFLAKIVNNWSYFVDKWNKVWRDFFLKTKYVKDPILFSLPIDGLLLGTTVENKVRTGSCCGSLCWLSAVRWRSDGTITYFTSTSNQKGTLFGISCFLRYEHLYLPQFPVSATVNIIVPHTAVYPTLFVIDKRTHTVKSLICSVCFLSVCVCAFFLRHAAPRLSKPQNFHRFSRVAPTPLSSCLNILGRRTMRRSSSPAVTWKTEREHQLMFSPHYCGCF